MSGRSGPGILGIAKRKELARVICICFSELVIPLVWLLPLAATGVSVTSCWASGIFPCTHYENSFIIWAWGWWSKNTGWLGTDEYKTQDTLRGLMHGALIYAIVASIILLCIIAGATGKRGKSEPEGSLYIFTLFNVLAGIILTMFYGFSASGVNACGAGQLAGGFTGVVFTKWTDPSPRERGWIKNRLDALLARVLILQSSPSLMDALTVQGIENELATIETDARKLGIGIDAKPVHDALPGIRARCNIQEALAGTTEVSIDTLRSVAGLAHDQFAGVLIELCDRFDLVIDGGKVRAKDGRDIGALVTEVDALFTRWRAVEATKSGKV